MADRYAHLRACLGDDLFGEVRNARLLVVGAGGIGCELLKNLVMTGFGTGDRGFIEVVDLDTIDVSNLNRQFLFRREHVGQPKATIARESVIRFNPDARERMKAEQANVIEDKRFSIEHIGGFDIVLNALDNLKARRHVNRLCVAKRVPLIESGTTGFLGQVQVIDGTNTQCYDCTPKPTPTSIPVCTIAAVPRKPVHCIEYGKHAFMLLFGVATDSHLYEGDTDTGEIDADSVYMNVAKHPADAQIADAAALRSYAEAVFDALFGEQIRKQTGMGVFEKCQRTPPSFRFAELNAAAPRDAAGASDEDDDRRVWDAAESARRFVGCIVQFWSCDERRAAAGSAQFDKDDALAMEFVTAASNLKATQFCIAGGTKSLHEAKGVAGNIIPAIATTNAIVAGIQVNEAIRILDAKRKPGFQELEGGLRSVCKFTWVRAQPDSRGALLSASALEAPNPACVVCSKAQRDITLDTKRMTLATFVERVLQTDLCLHEPTIDGPAGGLLETGQGADEDLLVNLPKTFADLGIDGGGTEMTIEDFSQEMEVVLHVYHRDADAGGDEVDADKWYSWGHDVPSGGGGGGGGGASSSSAKKRPLDADEDAGGTGAGGSAKRAKTA